MPTATRVWLRSAVRLRAEAEHSANRSLTWGLGIGGACVAGLGLSALGALRPTFDWLMTGAAAWIARLAPRAEEATDLIVRTFQGSVPIALRMLLGSVPIALAIVAGLVLTPLVAYFAFSTLWRFFFRPPPLDFG